MKNFPVWNRRLPLLMGIIVGTLAMIISVNLGFAAPLPQDQNPPVADGAQDCNECHLNITNAWADSAHANAYIDPIFQERWHGIGEPGECLLCHTTNYQATNGSFDAEGVSCEACHGDVPADHPPAAVPLSNDSEYCGQCHTTTLSEWRLTGHSTSGVGCVACHDPHSQQPRFEDPDDLCINCHKDDMEVYLEDTHVQRGIGCVDCHALVIPPDPIPIDGIVPTGHTFTITPATCVACHTDDLHAGFSLPGYDPNTDFHGGDGEDAAAAEGETPQRDEFVEEAYTGTTTSVNLSPEQQIQALETALASNNLATLFQGGVIGVVLGSTTAWFLSRNVRRSPTEDEDEDDEEEIPGSGDDETE